MLTLARAFSIPGTQDFSRMLIKLRYEPELRRGLQVEEGRASRGLEGGGVRGLLLVHAALACTGWDAAQGDRRGVVVGAAARDLGLSRETLGTTAKVSRLAGNNRLKFSMLV